jgi:hypothetical protein
MEVGQLGFYNRSGIRYLIFSKSMGIETGSPDKCLV